MKVPNVNDTYISTFIRIVVFVSVHSYPLPQGKFV